MYTGQPPSLACHRHLRRWGRLGVEKERLGEDFTHRPTCLLREATRTPRCIPRPLGEMRRTPECKPRLGAWVAWGEGESFRKEFYGPGTRDFAAWLAVTAAIKFYQRMGGPALRARNNALAAEAAGVLEEAWGVKPAAPRAMNGSMVTIALPQELPGTRAMGDRVHDALIDGQGIEVPIVDFANRLWVRISAQIYNEIGDYGRLREAMRVVLKGLRE